MLRPSLSFLPILSVRCFCSLPPGSHLRASECLPSRLLLRQNSSSLFSFSSSFRQRGFHVHVTVRQDARDCCGVWLAASLSLSPAVLPVRPRPCRRLAARRAASSRRARRGRERAHSRAFRGRVESRRPRPNSLQIGYTVRVLSFKTAILYRTPIGTTRGLTIYPVCTML